MNTTEVASRPSPSPRRVWRWLLAGTALCLGAATLAAYNLVTLPRDAATLRDELTSTLTHSTRTQFQVTVGPLFLTALRTVLSAFDEVPQEARLALGAVRNASVGVYKLRGDVDSVQRAGMFSAADEVMRERGWTAAVRVSDRDNLVLVYLPEGERSGSTERVCVAVCSEGNLVIVSGSVRMDRLVDLAVQQRLIAKR